MNVNELKPDMVLQYVTEADDAQVQWGSCADPRVHLVLGDRYTLERADVHSWHTKLFFVGVENGRGFNSVSFEVAE